MPHIKMRGVQKPKNSRRTIVRLLSYLACYRVLVFFVFLLTALSSLSLVFGTWLLKPALNDYIVPYIASKNADMNAFFRLILLLIFTYALSAGTSFLSARILLFVSTNVLKKIRTELFEKVEKLPLSFYDGKNRGSVMSLFTNDVDALRDMFSQSVPQLFSSILQVLLVFVMMCALSIHLTALLVLLVFVMMMLSAFLAKKSARAFRNQQAQIARANGFIEELVSGRFVVKAFTREEKSFLDFREINDSLCEAGTQANILASVIGPITNNLSHLQYAFCAVFGAVLIILGITDIGTVAAFLQSTRSFSQPLSQLSQQINNILNALAGAERIFSTLDEQCEDESGSVSLVYAKQSGSSLLESDSKSGIWAWKAHATGQLKKLKGELEFKSVDFSYKTGVNVLRHVSFSLSDGEKLALVGSTGSGKTTVASLISRFYDIKDGDGEILLDGIPISDIKRESVRRAVGMVLQDVNLFSVSVKDNIRYGSPFATDEEVERAAKMANADSFISRLPDGYNTILTGGGAALSQGQRQLLSIARSACAANPILLLDEATSSIDTRTESLVQKGINDLMSGRTSVVIAHRLSTVRGADKIIVLENGAVSEMGTHESLLLQKGKYWSLCTGGLRLQ